MTSTSLTVSAAIGMVGLAFAQPTGWADPLADAVLLALAAAIGLAAVAAARMGLARQPTPRGPMQAALKLRGSLAGGIVVGAVSLAASQTWFQVGYAIAAGDKTPPVGTAWLGHIFSPWVPVESGLGAPGSLETQLPWAAILAAVHAMGGSAVLAQRLWLTGLFVGAALAAYLLLRTLGLRAMPAVVGALVYVFNPFEVSWVGTNDVYLTTLFLLAALPCCVLAVGRGRLSILMGILLLGASAPLVGFAYANPPALGMVLLAAVAVVPLLAWLEGRRAAVRGLYAVGLGLSLLGVLSLYWAVPAFVALKTVVSLGSLSSSSSWLWTEARASVANALWLNTTWGWKYPLYYPYAPLYSGLALRLLEYLLPMAAFVALPMACWMRSTFKALRLCIGASGAAVLVIFLSTGTNPPGSILFDVMYHLPLGWLLQQPGRFLMVVGLCYAILIGVTAQLLIERVDASAVPRWMGRLPAASRHELQGTFLEVKVRMRTARTAMLSRAGRTELFIGGLLVLLLIPAFPLLTGATVTKARDGYPSAEVRVPGYWTAMASYINHSTKTGNLLLLPPDDFYQMPYGWYYGTDGFIQNMITREVIDPTAQGYDISSDELESAVSDFTSSLLGSNWDEASDLMTALGATQVLLRGDVIPDFAGRPILPPTELNKYLAMDPDFQRQHVSGPLYLYRVKAVPSDQPAVVTVNSASPFLQELSLFKPGTALVTSKMLPGVTDVINPPALASWKLSGHGLVYSTTIPAGRTVTLALLSSGGAAKVNTTSPVNLSQTTAAGERRVILRLPLGASQIDDGNFASGSWQPQVGDCHDVNARAAQPYLHAAVVANTGPGGTSALKLSASVDTACEHQSIDTDTGSLLLSMYVKHVQGAAPSACLWEYALDKCIVMARLPVSTGWSHYQALVHPNPGSKLALFVYASSTTPSGVGLTINEYASVAAFPVPTVDQPVLVAAPSQQAARPRLTTTGARYLPEWQTGSPARHVVIDGLRDGWLGASNVALGAISYTPAGAIEAGQLASGFGGVVTVLALGIGVTSVLRRRGHQGRRRGKKGEGMPQ